jgi:hypothetical protein
MENKLFYNLINLMHTNYERKWYPTEKEVQKLVNEHFISKICCYKTRRYARNAVTSLKMAELGKDFHWQ